MEVYINEIRGLADAICTLYLSKRNLSRDKEVHIRKVVNSMIDSDGLTTPFISSEAQSLYAAEFDEYIKKISEWGVKHHTLLKYLDFSCSVYGLHRGAQDDFDSHAERLDSRIVRSSTRLAKYGPGEKSDFYKGKIITTDEALEILGITVPDTLEVDDVIYKRAVNGYVRYEMRNDHDVLRGLYMLSIPSNFIFRCNIIQFAHIVAMRDKNSHAAPELREMIEKIISQLTTYTGGLITRKFLYEIERFNTTDIVD